MLPLILNLITHVDQRAGWQFIILGNAFIFDLPKLQSPSGAQRDDGHSRSFKQNIRLIRMKTRF